MNKVYSASSALAVSMTASLLFSNVEAFGVVTSSIHPTTALSMSFALDPTPNRPIYDPLGLYPETSPERIDNEIVPLESDNSSTKKVIIDPMNLYSDSSAIDSNADMSVAVPFLPRPKELTGELAGDVGFDPLGLASSKETLLFMREAEVKHSRIAMLAAVGWPVAELLHTKLAFLSHLKPLLVFGDRVPSVLNGNLSCVSPVYWVAAMALAGGLEVSYEIQKNQDNMIGETKEAGLAGDFGFDPLGLYINKDETRKSRMELAELKHGRLAMIAVTIYAIEEYFTGVGVVPQIISLLHPHSAAYLEEQGFNNNLEAILSLSHNF